MGDRLEWIFDRKNFDTLEARYDAWSAAYDEDHDTWGWRGPDVAAAAVFEASDGSGVALDAGCGTGRGGIALREAGWTGTVLGIDISQGMLGRAALSGTYSELMQGSLYDTSLATDSVDAIISTGVFTHGHVDATALEELCRITKPGGTVVITFRENIIDEYSAGAAALEAQGRWRELDRTEPLALHTGRPDAEQIKQHLVTWRVTS